MIRWNLQSSAFIIVSTALLTVTASAQLQKVGPAAAPAIRAAPAAPAPHIAAPAPRMAPAPHVAPAPHIAAPRVAPQISAPRAAPQISAPRVVPQQHARPPSSPSPGAITRHVETPRTIEGPQRERQIGGRNLGNQGGAQAGRAVTSPSPDLARQHATPTDGLGRNVTPPSQALQKTPPSQIVQNHTWQLAGGNRVSVNRALRNPFFANRVAAAGDPASRALARSTFHGRFFDPGWRRHHLHPIVIGWLGPLFWPYAQSDFVDYTFYPHAYDTFWPYAYDDVYEGIFGRYAYSGGAAYASTRRSGTESGGGGTAADLCSGRTAGLTEWPIERIAQAVEPDDAQRAALDDIKNAAANAVDVLKAACPTELPSTPIGRIAAMHQRLDAMLQGVRMVRPALEKFYQSLNDEQKARFNALSADDDQPQSARNLTQACGERAAGIASLPIEQIERTIGPNDAQRAVLAELRDATAQAVELLKSDCPTYRPLTPVVRLEAMEQRLDAMLRAVQTVEPALQKFYSSLSDEQKERLNRLPPRQA
jgi:ABC-type transporter MlaC component